MPPCLLERSWEGGGEVLVITWKPVDEIWGLDSMLQADPAQKEDLGINKWLL